jgi:predicted DNA-binding transcriptional regulator AlpA
MANRPAPLFATDRKAAELLDMKPAEFRALVNDGHLPKGREIAPGFLRWDVEQLRLIGKGEAVDGMGETQW